MSQIRKQKPPLFVQKRYNQQVNVMFMVRQKTFIGEYQKDKYKVYKRLIDVYVQ